MEWLNYHHLLYFWTVAREGTIARASLELRLAQPTISGQIRALEDQLGEKLFQRSGRNLVLTDVGRMVFRYADDIFTTGRELMDTLRDRPTGRPVRLQVGVADEVTKIIAYRLLEPALRLPQPVHIVCRDGPSERLLTDLATHALDLVIADAPIAPGIKVKAFTHSLGETPVTVFATPKLAAPRRKGFPRSLDGAPFLVPTLGKTLRRTLDHYFDQAAIRPRIVAELKDKMPQLAPAIRPGGGPAPVATLPEGLAARDAVSALTNLGYAHGEAASAVSAAIGKAGREARAEELIRLGLKELAQ